MSKHWSLFGKGVNKSFLSQGNVLQNSKLMRWKLCLHAQDAKEGIEPKSFYNGCDYQRMYPIY